ncbi:MAG: DUF4340 domain-containing protein [Polyangiaceae bacterium]|nr:DUF4340 domain-containing protein [Polyangiaceae bacterium]
MIAIRRVWLVNGSLAIMALALLVAVAVTSQSVTTGELQARRSSLLGSFRSEDVTRVVIDRREAPRSRATLERSAPDARGQTWTILEPFREGADAQRVQELLDTLDSATVARRVHAGKNSRKRFGLAEPRGILNVDVGPISYRLTWGGDAPSPHGAVYLEVAGKGVPRPGVVAISKQLAEELFVNVDQLRSRRLMPYSATELKQLALRGAGGLRILVRADWGGWRFSSRYDGARLNRGAIDRVLIQLARLEATRLIEPWEAERALADVDDVSIEAVPKDTRRPSVVLRVGGRCPSGEGVVALEGRPDRRAGCVPATVMSGLTMPAEALVDEQLLSLEPEEVERLAIVYGKNRLEMARKSTGFRLIAPESLDVPAEAGQQLLELLTHAKGRIVERKAADVDSYEEPAGRIVVTPTPSLEGQKDQVLLVAQEQGEDGAHVLRTQDGAVLEVDKHTAKLLRPRLTLLRAHELFTWKPESLTAVQLDVEGVRQHVKITGHGQFELVQPSGYRCDAGAVGELLNTLSSLRAERWVAENDRANLYGVARAKSHVHMSLLLPRASTPGAPRAGFEARTIELRLGYRGRGGWYASLSDRSGIFLLARSAVERFQRLLVDRSPFIVTADEASTVSLEQEEGHKLELIASGDKFVQPATQIPLSSDALDELTEALASLRAESAIHLGGARAEEGISEPRLTVQVRWRQDAAKGRCSRWRIGASDAWQGTAIYYARADCINATYAIARSRLDRVLDAL